VPDLEPGIVEKLLAAGITTVEQVADMTPEQLEEIPGVGPKTVEKISIAVNNYFSSLEAAAAPLEEAAVEEGAVEGEEVVAQAAQTKDPVAEEASEELAAAEEEAAVGEEQAIEVAEADGEQPADEVPSADEDSGDLEGLSQDEEASSESVEGLVDEGQYYEAEVVDGVENVPPADEAEVHTHERPEVEGENVPDEEMPGEQR
jgi:N utilization substance protein A